MTAFSFLTRAKLPRNALVIDGHEVAAVEVRRRGGRFGVSGAAFEVLPPGLCVPSFDGQNIPNPEALSETIARVVEAAGLSGRQRWSVLIPEAAVKTVSVTFDSLPATRAELAEMVNWKTKQMVGVPASELRISRQLVTAGATPRFLAVATRTSVLGEYESLLAGLGWKVGVLVPRYVGEAAWLDWDATPGDKLMIGARVGACTAAFVRGGELLFVRTPLDSDPARLDDEVYRLALFYRDRIAASPERASLTRLLACGPVDGERVSRVIGDALGTAPSVVHPVPELLEMDAPEGSLASISAAAGIATQAWIR